MRKKHDGPSDHRIGQADAGSVLLEGEEILGRKGRRQREVYRKIQMVFQTPQDSFDPMQTLETGILEAGIRE